METAVRIRYIAVTELSNKTDHRSTLARYEQPITIVFLEKKNKERKAILLVILEMGKKMPKMRNRPPPKKNKTRKISSRAN